MAHVSYESRYDPHAEYITEATADRPLALLDALVRGPVPGTPWWGVKAESGGQIVEMSTHAFDLVRHVAGEVERVVGYGSHEIVDEIDFEDATAVSMRHESGAISHVSSTSASPDWSIEGIHSVVGEDLRLDWDGTRLTGVVDGEEVEREADADNHRREDRAFVKAVREGDPDPLKCPYDDAVRSLELTLAAQEAIETGEEVVL
jgi:predicted dehydrogenase